MGTGDVDATAVVVVSLVVLAGCSGLGPAEPTAESVETVTPVPVGTETATPTATPAPAWRAPGFNGTVITDVDALLDSHVRYLSNRSYTLEWSRRTAGGSGPVANAFERQIAVENDTRYRRVSTGTTYPGVVRTFVDATGVYHRVDAPNGSTDVVTMEGGVEAPRERFAVIAVPIVDMLVQPGAMNVTLVERDGTRYARLFTQRVPPYFANVYDDYNIRNFTGTVWVHPEGYLRSVHYSFTLTRVDERIDVAVRYDYTGVGTTSIAEPTWVASVKSGANASATGTPPTPNATATPTGNATDTPTESSSPTGTATTDGTAAPDG